MRASSAALGAGRGLLQVGLCPLNAAAHIYSLRLEDLLWQVTLLTHIPALGGSFYDTERSRWKSSFACFLFLCCSSLYAALMCNWSLFHVFFTRSDTVRYALDILSILTVVPKVQLVLAETVEVQDEARSPVSTVGQ